MKISIDKLKQIPGKLSNKFGVCVYGEMPDHIKEWVDYHGFEVQELKGFTNIFVNRDPYDVFVMPDTQFAYMDGFSPNLNKKLHMGHLSNLVYAKAFRRMGFAEASVSILGDTLTGVVANEDGYAGFKELCSKSGYTVDMELFASDMKLEDESILKDGTGIYEGTKVFNINGDRLVGMKSAGSTTYFYQDVALAQKLGTSTLYLTGSEQNEHFKSLNALFPDVQHIGLGLVKANGRKMSSREGNFILIDLLMEVLMESFDNYDLAYNVFAGYILRTAPSVEKNIDLSTMDNPKSSPGLYLSYTLARLKSAGVNVEKQNQGRPTSKALQFAYMKAKGGLMPNWFFSELTEHAKKINSLYETHQIKGGSEETMEMFEELGADLAKSMRLLGMFEVDAVPKRETILS